MLLYVPGYNVEAIQIKYFKDLACYCRQSEDQNKFIHNNTRKLDDMNVDLV